MRKLWPIMKVIWTLVIIALVVSIIAQLPYDEPRPEVIEWILSDRVFYILAIVFIGLILITFIAWWAHNRHANQQLLESEFALCVEGKNLKPEHFDYEAVDPGETPTSGRPFHQVYVPRHVAKFEDSTEPSHTEPAETFLSESLRNGATVALLGQQTDGKTRTIFEVCKGLINCTILRPRIAGTPSNSAIQLLKGKNVIIFFDDLEQYVHKDYDPKEMIRKIRERANSCGVIVTCRDSEELKAVKSDRPEYSTPLKRFFSDIKERYRLVDLDEEGKRKLWKSARTDALPETFELFKTVGSICMENGYQVMRDKFDGLPPKSQYCVWAIQLLLRGSILPLSHKRVVCVMRKIFQHPDEPVPSTLRPLRDRGFLKSDDDPIIPEIAYLRWWGSDSVITYRGNRMPEDDFDSLKSAIESCGDVEALISLGVVHGNEGRHDDALSCFELSSELTQQISPELIALALFNKGLSLTDLDRPEEAITAYEEIITLFGDASEPDLRERVAETFIHKGIALTELNRLEEAITAYEEIITLFGDASEPALRKYVGRALINQGVTLNELSRPEDAITACEEVITRFSDTSDPDLRELVAGALANKGAALAELNQPEDAITAWDEVIARYSDDPALGEQVANALSNKGHVLWKLSRSEDAITTLDKVIGRFSDASAPALRKAVGGALLHKGLALNDLSRPEEAITVLQEVINRFGNASALYLREPVAGALFHKGLALNKLSRPEDAITAWDEVIARFGDASEPALLQPVADALSYKGIALTELNQPEKAITALDELINRFGDASELALSVAAALTYKGLALRKAHKLEDAITVYEEVINRFGDASDHNLRKAVAEALSYKGIAQAELNRLEDAITAWDEVVTRFGDATDPYLRDRVTDALTNQGYALMDLNRLEDAISIYEKIIKHLGDASDPALRKEVAEALFNKGHVLKKLNRPEDMIFVYEEVINRFGDASDHNLRKAVAGALFSKGLVLIMLRRPEEAITALEDVITRFGEASETAIQEFVSYAHRLRQNLEL